MKFLSLTAAAALFLSAAPAPAQAGEMKCHTTHGTTLCTFAGPQTCYIKTSTPRRCVVTVSGGLNTVTLTDTAETMRFDFFNSGTVEIIHQNGATEMGVLDASYKVEGRTRLRTGSGDVYNLPE